MQGPGAPDRLARTCWTATALNPVAVYGLPISAAAAVAHLVPDSKREQTNVLSKSLTLPGPLGTCCCRTTSNAGYGSGRNSYAGSIVDPLNGSLPGSGRSSYAGVVGAQCVVLSACVLCLCLELSITLSVGCPKQACCRGRCAVHMLAGTHGPL
jgi:hypothetical protein